MKRKRLLAIIMVFAFMTTFMVSTTSAAPAEVALECLDGHDGEHEVIVHYDDAVLSSSDIDLSWDDNGDEILPDPIIVLARWVPTGFFSGYWEPLGNVPDLNYYVLTHSPSWNLLDQYYEYSLITPNPEHVGIFIVDVDDSTITSGYRISDYTVVESVYENHEPNPGSVVSSSTWIESSVPFELTSPCYDSPGKIDWNVTVNLEVEATFVSEDGTSTVWVDQGSTPTAPVVEDPFFTGWDPEVGPIDEPTTFTAQYRDPVPNLTLTKVASPDSGVVAGDVVTYTFTIENDGETVISGVALSDAGVDFAPGVTEIGDMSPEMVATVTGTYTITEADMFTGEYVNNASVEGTYNEEPVTAQATETVDVVDAEAGIGILKTTDAVNPDLGDTVTYTFTVRNTGNVSLTGVTISDPTAIFATGDNVIGSLSVGTTAIKTATRVVTEDDLWVGSLYNEASATGYDMYQNEVMSSSALTIDTAEPDPSISVTKEVDTGNGTDLGDTVDYTITVENTGNVTLYSVLVEDELLSDLTYGGVVGTMAPDAVVVLTGTYTITEDDIWAGIVENTATGSGLTVEQGEVSDTGSAEFETADIAPAVTIEKAADAEPAEVLLIGDTVVYTFTVTNTGNVTLDDVTITDSAIGYDETVTVDLAPGDSMVIPVTGSYVIQEIDSFTGSFTNVASVVGSAGMGDFQTEPSDSNEVTVLVQAAMPMISLTKVALVEEGVVPTSGDMLSYEITVINNGNVTLYNVMVDDIMIGLTEGPLTLAPGESETFTVTDAYTVTEADMFEGVVANHAQTVATTETQIFMSSSAISIVDVEDAAPSVDITKTSDQASYYAGEKITYTITVENTGNVTIYDGVVNDDMLGGTVGTFEVLAPGETVSFEGEYVTTAADVPGITNLAEIIAYTYDGDISPLGTEPSMVSDETEHFVNVSNRPAPRIPGVSVTIVPDSALVDEGTTVEFTMTVTNVGNAVLNEVSVVNSELGVNETITDLYVGTSQQITASMAMTTVGDFVTTVTANGTSASGSVSSTDSTIVEVIEGENIPENPPEEPEEPVVPPEEPTPGGTTENPKTGAIPFGILSASGFLAMGAGALGLFFRKKEDEEE